MLNADSISLILQLILPILPIPTLGMSVSLPGEPCHQLLPGVLEGLLGPGGDRQVSTLSY